MMTSGCAQRAHQDRAEEVGGLAELAKQEPQQDL